MAVLVEVIIVAVCNWHVFAAWLSSTRLSNGEFLQVLVSGELLGA